MIKEAASAIERPNVLMAVNNLFLYKKRRDLQLTTGEWAISDHLGSIHCNALEEADFKILKDHGAISNCL